MLEYTGEIWQAEPEQDNDVHSLSRRITLKKKSRPAPKIGYKALVVDFLELMSKFRSIPFSNDLPSSRSPNIRSPSSD